MAKLLMVEASSDSSQGHVLRGAVRQLWGCKDPEVMVAGPAETGKTFGCLVKLNALLWKYPNSQALLARKTYKSLTASVIQSYERKVIPHLLEAGVVKKFGGEKPEFYQYENESRLWVVGLDNADKVLSAEFDFSYVNQTEELSIDDWEKLLTRTTGRSGNAPYAQLYGDCNPGPANHWIKGRFGPSLLQSRHEDNPSLFDEAILSPGDEHYEHIYSILTDAPQDPSYTQETALRRIQALIPDVTYARLHTPPPQTATPTDPMAPQAKTTAGPSVALYTPTDQGKRSIHALDSLTGVRYQRLRLGNWVANEGIVYDGFDVSVHVIHPVNVPRLQRFLEAVDFGFTNAFCWQRWGVDGDGRTYLTHEVYYSQRLVEDHCRIINDITRHLPPPEITLCDHDAEGRSTYERYRHRRTVAADKEITPGIMAVQARLRIAGDGKPRLYLVSDCLHEVDPKLKEAHKPTCTLEEFGFYSWNEEKDVPIKDGDHGMDPCRYIHWFLDMPRSKSRRPSSYSFSNYSPGKARAAVQMPGPMQNIARRYASGVSVEGVSRNA